MATSNSSNNGAGGDGDMDTMDFQDDVEGSSSAINTLFDQTIGHIEDIIMEAEFQTLQTEFMEKYYIEFEDTEENKFIYTDIHNEYVNLIEKYLENQLKLRMHSFSMADFQRQLIEQKDWLDGEVFEMLMTFSDFVCFKEMFVDYKAEKEGRTVDLSSGFTVTSLAIEHGIDTSLHGMAATSGH